MEIKEAKNPVQSAERIFQVLETLSDGPIGLMDISKRLNLHKSTTHRLLTSLIYMNYAKQDEYTGKYTLTFKIVELSGKILSSIDMLSIAHPYVEHLAFKCQETVHLVQRNGNDMVYIDKVEPPTVRESAIRMASQIGLARPMYCSGVGKAILAELPVKEVEMIWENSIIEKRTEHTIVTLEHLLEELGEIHKKGYAIDNEENEIGVRCIAACIFDYHGKARHAFSISAPSSRMSEERIKELSRFVLQTKKELSKELGYRQIESNK